MPLNFLREERQRALLLLEDRQALNQTAEEAERRINDFCQRVSEALEGQDFVGNPATFSAFGVKVTAMKYPVLISCAVDNFSTYHCTYIGITTWT